VPAILNDLQDPDLFIDEDGKAYMYWGSSNVYPIRAVELDRSKAFRPFKKSMGALQPGR
jgi:beta-xylosidase